MDPRASGSWRRDAIALIDTIATARRDHEGLRLSTRWNARARRERAALGRAEEALLSGERIAIYSRSMARALADGSGNARPMPNSQRDAREHGIGHRGLHRVGGLGRHASRPPATGQGGSRRRRHPHQRACPGTTTMGQRPRSMAHLRDDAGDEPADPGRGRPPARPSRTRACLTADARRQRRSADRAARLRPAAVWTSARWPGSRSALAAPGAIWMIR